MAKWLVKSEPAKWSWDDQLRAKRTSWDGVRNAQALSNMRAMKKGDEVLFYHSVTGKEIVGLARVVKEFYPDPDDQRSGLVDLEACETLPKPVTLAELKTDERLKNIALIRQSRLSVMPIDDEAWAIIMMKSGLAQRRSAKKGS
jgi:predicted RNA-binding protein with PUA-like domain